MPGFGSDLGFVAVAVVVAAAIWFSARRRWRKAAARAEEVRRLAWLAAEEAARAEAEAAGLAYMAPALASDDGDGKGGGEIGVGEWAMRSAPAPGPPQCAVCYRHTTTRCSRCKSIRYCSGKCQILHWRQGHKDECHPPVNKHKNGGESVPDLSGLHSSHSDVSENSVEIETKTQPKPPEISAARSSPEPPVVVNEDHIEIEPIAGRPETENLPDSFAASSSSTSFSSSSSCSTFSGLLETSDDTSGSDDAHALQYGKKEMSSCEDILPEGTTTAVQVSEVNCKKVLPLSVGSCADNLYRTTYVKENVPNKANTSKSNSTVTSRAVPVCSDRFTSVNSPEDASVLDRDHMKKVDGSSHEVSSDLLTFETRTPSLESTTQPSHQCSAALDKEKQSSLAKENSNDMYLLKSKSMKTLPVPSSMVHESSNGGRHSVSCDRVSKIGSSAALATKAVEPIGSMQNGGNAIKPSTRKVVQQLKSSNLPKHSSGARCDISRKYKMLFPYDLFVKLYNCDKVDLRPFGLTNCGNSCYANAVLQSLAFTRPLASYLLQGCHAKTCRGREWCFTCELANLLTKAKQGQSPLSPTGILSHLNKIGSNLGLGREEDAHEFLRYAIDTMQSACLKEAGIAAHGSSIEDTTLIQLIFGGYLRSKIKCTRCRGKSERQERLMDLTVEIHGDITTLEEALARFTATEILDGDNKYHCSRCKSYERAKKKLTVLEAPNVLTIALKRFQSGKFGKLNKAVRFPDILDLAPYMSGTDDKSPVYSLYSVVVHQDIMNAAFSGHYVCYVKSTQGKWYKTDDSRVKPVEIGRVLSKNAYMLFYARCSPRAPSLIRSVISHDNLKTKRSKGKDSLLSSHAPSVAQQRNHEHNFHRVHGAHSNGSHLSNLFNERLGFLRTDSSSDSSSLLSCSDEGSCSTESTRDSTSTEELSEYIFGGSDRFSRISSSIFSDDSDGYLSSPLVARHSYGGEGEALNYGERLSWERGEVVEGREDPPFLYPDTTNQQFRELTGDCRGRETDREQVAGVKQPNVLIRRSSSSSRERRAQTFY